MAGSGSREVECLSDEECLAITVNQADLDGLGLKLAQEDRPSTPEQPLDEAGPFGPPPKRRIVEFE